MVNEYRLSGDERIGRLRDEVERLREELSRRERENDRQKRQIDGLRRQDERQKREIERRSVATGLRRNADACALPCDGPGLPRHRNVEATRVNTLYSVSG